MQMSSLEITMTAVSVSEAYPNFEKSSKYVTRHNAIRSGSNADHLAMSTLSDDMVGGGNPNHRCKRSYKVFGHPDQLKRFIKDNLCENQLDVYLDWVDNIVL